MTNTNSAIWEPFLTKRDHQHLELTWSKRQPFGLGRRPAVLVIDNYWSALGEEPLPLLEAAKRWPTSCGEEGWAAIERTQPVLAAARAAGVPVIYTTNREDAPPWVIQEDAERTRVPADTSSRRYTIVADLAPEPGELVIEKTAPSGFFCTPLIVHLTNMLVDTVLVTGNSTSGCVRATAVDASSHRLRVGVLEDCVFDRTQAAHAINLFDLNQKYADVMSSEDAISYLSNLASG